MKKKRGWYKTNYLYAMWFIYRNKLKPKKDAYGYQFWGDDTGFVTIRKSYWEPSRFRGYQVLINGCPIKQRMGEMRSR